MKKPSSCPGTAGPAQGGVALIVVLQLLVVVSILGTVAAQVSLMGERGARNTRDLQSALQSAEAGLADAIQDIDGATGATARPAAFDGSANEFADGCGTTASNRGLCRQKLAGKPAWQSVDLADAARTAGFGDFTGRVFASGAGMERGVRPALAPRYVIEAIDDRELMSDLSAPPRPVYRITAMGFGTRRDIQAVVQALYRKRED